jgi:RHS repeat-associated protein
VTGPDGFCEEKYHVYSPEGKVATRTLRGGSTVETRYYHTDGLGSIVAVSDEFGRIEKRFAYDPWGQRDMPLDTHTGEGGGITRGFTDHEHLDDFGLIHMNGRVFDPVLARFLSADPFVQGAGNSQAYNRYSYCGNNPLNATDPSGYLTFDEVLRVVVIVVMVVAVAYSAGTAAAAAGWGTFGSAAAAGAAGGFVGGFVGTLAYGGSLNDAFKAGAIGAVIGAATAVASAGIGTYFNLKQGIWANSYVNWTGRTLSHAVVGGLSSEAQGGEFRHGFYSSALSNGVMHIKGVESFMWDSAGGWHVAARTAIAALIGGTAAELSGGKFANGAWTSALQHLFNSEVGKAEEREWMGKKRLVLAGYHYARAIYAFPDDNSTIVKMTGEADAIAKLMATPDSENYINIKDYDRIILYGEGGKNTFSFGTSLSLYTNSGIHADSELFIVLAKLLTSDAALVFAACNTGNGLANDISESRSITVYAPKVKVGVAYADKAKKNQLPGVYEDSFINAPKAQFYEFKKTP